MTAANDAGASCRIGVDIGGTFTDLMLLREGRPVATAKTPTTPEDPSVGVEQGIGRLLADQPAENLTEGW